MLFYLVVCRTTSRQDLDVQAKNRLLEKKSLMIEWALIFTQWLKWHNKYSKLMFKSKQGFSTHLWQLSFSIKGHQNEDIGHCQRHWETISYSILVRFFCLLNFTENFQSMPLHFHSGEFGCLTSFHYEGEDEIVVTKQSKYICERMYYT